MHALDEAMSEREIEVLKEVSPVGRTNKSPQSFASPKRP